MSFNHLNVTPSGILNATRAPFDYNTRRRFGRRLLALHTYLSAVPSSHYKHQHLASKVVKDQPCGAVACAFGHAVVSGKFPNILATYKAKFDDKGIAVVESAWVPEVSVTFKTKKDRTILTRLKKLLGDNIRDYDFYALDLDDIKDDMRFPADEYFGPGAWDTIFDLDAYGFDRKAINKAKVMKRIADVAEKVYGVKLPTKTIAKAA